MLADEVKLVRFNSEVVRVPYDRPFVEYQIYRDQPRVVDLHTEMPMIEVEVYKAKVHVFRTSRSRNDYTELKVALDQETQNIVDMFVKDATRELKDIICDYQRVSAVWEKKARMTCWERLLEKHEWLRRVGALFA